MPLAAIEREFLARLAQKPWDSPPLFDHNLISRLAEAGYVEMIDLGNGTLRYTITETGRDTLVDDAT